MSRAVVALVFAAGLAGPALGQDAAELTGHWTGIIDEQGDIPQYTLSVHINLDPNGDPVGLVEYDAFPCAGVWNSATSDRGRWLLVETITTNVGICAEHVAIELTPRSDGDIDIRLAPIGFEVTPATGTLRPRP